MRSVIVTAVLIAAVTVPARAGTTGALTGSISDGTSGAPVAGATVTIDSPAFHCQAVSDSRGSFAFLALPPDRYVLSIEKDKYNPDSIAGIVILADRTEPLRLRLQRRIVTVTGDFLALGFPRALATGSTTDAFIVNGSNFPNFNDRLIRIGDLLKVVPGVVTVP